MKDGALPAKRTSHRNDTATARQIGLLVHLALPEEINVVAVGADVKKTVMTVSFLVTCISNMIGVLERRHASDGNKKRVLPQSKAL